MEERIGPLQALLASFVPAKYASIRRMGGGSIFLVLVLLALIPALLASFHAHRGSGKMFDEFARLYEERLPELHLKDGQLTIEGNRQAMLPDPELDPEETEEIGFVLIIDGTGEFTEIPDQYDKGGILVTPAALVVRNQMGQVQEVPWKKVEELTGELVLNGDYVRARSAGWSLWIGAIVFLIAVLYYLVAKTVHGLFLSLLSLMGGRSSGPLEWGDAFKIAVVALTPAVTLQVLKSIAGLEIPFFLAIYLVVGGAFAWIGGSRAGGSGGSGDLLQPAGKDPIPRVDP